MTPNGLPQILGAKGVVEDNVHRADTSILGRPHNPRVLEATTLKR